MMKITNFIFYIFLLAFVFSNKSYSEYPCSIDSAITTVAELSGEIPVYIDDLEYILHTRRYTQPQNNYAGIFLADKVEKLGYEIQTKHYPFHNTENIIFEKKGILYPDRYIVVCAHYDSDNFDAKDDPNIEAPGACDNASGVAAILEIARNIFDKNLKYSVRFVLFDSEESGLQGSAFYVDELKNTGGLSDIYSVINIDMIAQDTGDHRCVLKYREINSSRTLAENSKNIIEKLNIDLFPETTLSKYIQSDSHSFWEENVTTVFFTQKARINEFFHTSKDIIDNFNIPYYEQMINAVYAVVLNVSNEGLKTSITDDLTKNKITLYPNPVQDYLNISSDNNITNIRLFNSVGNEVDINIDQSGVNVFRIETSSLSRGFYLLHVEHEKGHNVYKIIKN